MNRNRTTIRTAGRLAARLALVPAIAIAATATFGSGHAAASGFDIPLPILPLPLPTPAEPAMPSLPIDFPVLPVIPDFPVVTLPDLPVFPEIPMPDFPGLPGLPGFPGVPVFPSIPTCTHIDLTDLDLRAAQSSPDDFQWRVQIDGDTSDLCDDWFVAQMQDTATGAVQSVGFTIDEVVTANQAGNDYVVTLTTACDYLTDVHFGDEYVLLSQFAGTKDCSSDPVGVPGADDAPTVDSGDPVVPADPAEDAGVTDTTVPAPAGSSDQTSTDGQLPHTGSDSTTTMVAGGLLVLGLGMGALTIGIARRRQAA